MTANSTAHPSEDGRPWKHDFAEGDIVAVIGRVVRMWPDQPGLPSGLQVRFASSSQVQGWSHVPVPADIVQHSDLDIEPAVHVVRSDAA
jgi:hypothetical protein